MNSQSIQVGTNRVSFQSQGHKLAGLLFTPEGFDPAKPYPTVLFTGPFNQIKEQTGAVYGKKLAQQGYLVLSFDHLGHGDSEGGIRHFEQPFLKMEAIRDAISYLSMQPFVDRSQLYGLGVCAGGGYLTLVATTDKRLRAVATVSGMMDNSATFFGVMSKEQLLSLFEMANQARQRQYETGEVEYYDALGMEAVDPAARTPGSAQAEGYEYYMTPRGGAASYPNYSHLSPMNLMEYSPMTSAQALAPYLYTPYLGIYGERAMQDTGPLTVAFYNAASEPKQLAEIKGASHVSLYDVDEDVDQAVETMVKFFKQY